MKSKEKKMYYLIVANDLLPVFKYSLEYENIA